MFEWKKEYELGITSIDTQHQELFHFANRIYELLINQSEETVDFDEISTIIDALKEYTNYHFKSEEELFAKYKYPDAKEHIEEHEAFWKYVEELDIEDMIHQPKELLRDLVGKLANWIFHHMITTDYLFKEYLVKLGKV